MSWKGFTKAVSRLPQRVLQKAGYAEETTDDDFEKAESMFKEFEHAAKTLTEDSKSYATAIKGVLTHQRAIGASFQALYSAFEGEQRSRLEQCALDYVNASSDWNESQTHAQDERLARCVVAPAENLLATVRLVRGTIDKRNRKQIDHDRHLTNLKKAREKTNTQDLIKAEQNYAEAKAQYDLYNNMLKEQVPVLYTLRVAFMDPVMESLIQFQIAFFEQAASLMTPLTAHLDMLSSDIIETHKSQWTPVIETMGTFQIFNPRMFDPNAPIPGLEPPPATDSTTNLGSSSAAGGRDETSPVAAKPAYVSPKAAAAAASYDYGSQDSYTNPPASDVVGRAVALYPFISDTDGDLSFNKDDQIEIVQMTESTDDWWTGRMNGTTGIFPANYVQLL